MNQELKRIFPEEIYKLSTGEEVSVSPVPFGKLARFGEALASLLTKIGALNVSLDDPQAVGKVFGVAFDEIISIMALVLNKDKEWFNRITVEDGIGLLTVILAQNFNESTKKKLDLLLPRLQSVSTS